MKKYIIAGFAGIGKTTLDRKNDNVIDMEIRNYKYADWHPDYDLHQWYREKEHTINDNWLEKYYKAIQDEIKNGTHKIIFVWINTDVLDWMKKEKIDYTMAYWNLKEEGIKDFLKKLYEKRGNSQEWTESVLNYLDVINEYAIKNKMDRIILNENENIEMKLKELKWLE